MSNEKMKGEKKNWWKEHADEKTHVFTMDLESVLLCPKTAASAMYYKQKLQLHNFSIYELRTQDVDLYVWHECNGGVNANEFVSCIADYITRCVEQRGFEKVVIVSDGCNYQNRNKCLSSTLSALAVKYKIEIIHLYLEKGHTMMEVDSVHSTLEHYFYPPIYSPAEYVARMRMA